MPSLLSYLVNKRFDLKFNSLHSDKIRRFMKASDPRTGRQASDSGERGTQTRSLWKLIGITIGQYH